MATHLVKVKLDGDLRIMEIPSPPRFDALVEAVTEAYGVPSGRATELTFTYWDRDGDEVRFDTDTELDLAVRTSSVPLRIMVQNSRSGPTGTERNPQTSAAAAAAAIPSTPGYAVASNVGSVTGDAEADMIMVDLAPPGQTSSIDSGDNNSAGGAASGGETENNNQGEIDAPAAFEAEAAAARDPEGSLLYQKASMRLAKRFNVHVTPTQLWRVMALFQIQGRQLITVGLAPQRALDTTATPCAARGSSSDEEGNGAASRGGVKRNKDSVARSLVANPVQRLLSLNGVDLPEEEVQPLLEALRVRPRRLVKLNLLAPEVLEEMPDDHREGRGPRGGRFGHPMHGPGHAFGHPMHGPGGPLIGRGGGGGGRGGGRGGPQAMPFHPPPPFHHHPHHAGMFPWPHGGGSEGDQPLPHGPPPHVVGKGGAHMDPPHGHKHRGNHPPAAHMYGEGPHQPPMWQPSPGGFGGYGYGYGGPAVGGGGGWHEWAGPYGGGGGGGGGGGCGGGGRAGAGGGPGCGRVKRGFGKGTKDNMAMARFVSHPSGSDVTKVAAGQTFKKSWLVRNDSTTTWPETCSLLPVSQGCSDLSTPPKAPIVGDVAPGEEVTVSVDLVAPLQPGMYEGYWRACDSSARRFGQRLWAKVMVVGPGQDGVNAAVERLSLDDNGNGATN